MPCRCFICDKFELTLQQINFIPFLILTLFFFLCLLFFLSFFFLECFFFFLPRLTSLRSKRRDARRGEARRAKYWPAKADGATRNTKWLPVRAIDRILSDSERDTEQLGCRLLPCAFSSSSPSFPLPYLFSLPPCTPFNVAQIRASRRPCNQRVASTSFKYRLCRRQSFLQTLMSLLFT